MVEYEPKGYSSYERRVFTALSQITHHRPFVGLDFWSVVNTIRGQLVGDTSAPASPGRAAAVLGFVPLRGSPLRGPARRANASHDRGCRDHQYCFFRKLRGIRELARIRVPIGSTADRVGGAQRSGKSTLTKLPFSIGVGQSENIAIDRFCHKNIPSKGVSYREAVNRVALRKVVRTALGSAPVVVVEGPVAWPLIEPIADAKLQRACIRRVYLKRMMPLRAKIWVDEDFLANPASWPPSDFHRSIYEYHAQGPWSDANLVLERIVDEVPRPAGMLIFGR